MVASNGFNPWSLKLFISENDQGFFFPLPQVIADKINLAKE